jgi:hypothetical protein
MVVTGGECAERDARNLPPEDVEDDEVHIHRPWQGERDHR